MAEDVKTGSEASAEHQEAAAEDNQDKSLKDGNEPDNSQGEESIKAVPYERFKEINDAKKQSEAIVNWYRTNIGDPKEVVAFSKWKSEQLRAAKEAESEGEITPQRLAQIREIMRKADPEYAEYINNAKEERAAKEEAQWDDAAEMVTELAVEQLGLKAKTDESKINKIGQYVMLAIQNDKELLRKWKTGNLSCVKKAFATVLEDHESLGKSLTRMRQDTVAKRLVKKVPTLPSGNGSLSQDAQKGRLKGLQGDAGKQAGNDAWDLIQQSARE